MVPAIEPGDWLIVNPLAASWPRRGAVVVFHEPMSDALAIKRVQAGPGERRLPDPCPGRSLARRRRSGNRNGRGRFRPADRLDAVRAGFARQAGRPRAVPVRPAPPLRAGCRRGCSVRPDPNLPLPPAPDPWAGSEMPPRRDGPPYHMTEMIEAEPALAMRLLERLADPTGPASRLAAAIHEAAERNQPIVVTGCGTSEHGALATVDIWREALQTAGLPWQLGRAGTPVAVQAFEGWPRHRDQPRRRDVGHEPGPPAGQGLRRQDRPRDLLGSFAGCPACRLRRHHR
jgi:hypothetical protein